MATKKRKTIKTSNTEGRSTVMTNTRSSAYRDPKRPGKKKQKLVTVMSGGY